MSMTEFLVTLYDLAAYQYRRFGSEVFIVRCTYQLDSFGHMKQINTLEFRRTNSEMFKAWNGKHPEWHIRDIGLGSYKSLLMQIPFHPHISDHYGWVYTFWQRW